MEGSIQNPQDFEIIDLESTDASLIVNESVDDHTGSSLLNEIISDEKLYSKYLCGEIGFDDLMRKMHRSDSPVREENLSSASSESDATDDPLYSCAHARSKRVKNIDERPTKERKTRIQRGSLPVELAQYMGEAERHLNNGEFEQAERICYEITETAPKASQPYVVLAEISYRQGNLEKTKKLLFEAVQRNPNDTNSWLTLVDLAEDKNDLPLAICYARNALRHARHDLSIRERLIKFCQKTGRTHDVLQLKLSALSTNPEPTGEVQFTVARELADEFFKLGDPYSSIRAYENAFEKFPMHGNNNDRNTALSMMVELKRYEQALKFFIKFCDVTIYLKSTGQLEPAKLSSQLQFKDHFKKIEYPNEMSPELYLKLFYVVARLGLGPLAFSQIKSAYTTENMEKSSVWLLDIIRAFKDCKMYSMAIELLLVLSKSEVTSSLKQIWILLAECYLEEGQTDKALESYRHVTNELDPRDTNARFGLVNLLRRLGHHQEALNVLNPTNLMQKNLKNVSPIKSTPKQSLKMTTRSKSVAKNQAATKSKKKPQRSRTKKRDISQSELDDDDDENQHQPGEEEQGGDEATASEEDFMDEDYEDGIGIGDKDLSWLKCSPDFVSRDPLAYRLAFERCRMLDNPQTEDAFLEETWSLLFSDVTRVCGLKLTQLALILDSEQHRKLITDRLTSITPNLSHSISTAVSPADSSQLNDSDIWALFLRLVDVLRARLPKSLPQLETATAWACFLPHVHSSDVRRLAASHLLISASLIGRHGTPAFLELKNIEKQWSHKNQFWNVFNLSLTLSSDYKHFRYLNRLVNRDGLNLALGTIASCDTLVRGSVRYGVARLINVHDKYPDDPLLSLLLAVGFLTISGHKFITSRHLNILQAIGFLSKYRRLRGPCQEVYYNYGRFFQELALMNYAIYYYEKVLEMEPVGSTLEEKQITNVHKEAAFNLVLIYRSAGNFDMARLVMQQHLVI